MEDESFEQNEHLKHLVAYLREQSDRRKPLLIHVQDECRWFDTVELRRLLSSVVADESKALFRLCLFKWQYDHEAKYRWEADYARHVQALQEFRPRIAEIACELLDGNTWEFARMCEMQVARRRVTAVADLVNADRTKCVVCKFSTGSVSTRDLIFAAGCARMLSRDCTAEILNLRTGDRENVRVRSDTVFDGVVLPIVTRALNRGGG